ISPRGYFPDYRIQVPRRELASLQLRPEAELYVFTTLSGRPEKMTTNLQAPILINLSRRLGCQVVAEAEQPVQRRIPTVYSLEEARSQPLSARQQSVSLVQPRKAA
ncbi:MAG: flagellar assembly protein FliW, partial [Planctomycetota bacterium]